MTQGGEEEHTLSPEACAISRLLLFTLQAHHAASPELQRRTTMQLWEAYRQARKRLASLQGSLVRACFENAWRCGMCRQPF
ncbi:UNVERIFIED_CONTAM: hypothetical protein FKN15_000247 [Acipenser sinensis]